MADSTAAVPLPAATVVLIRDGADGCQILLVRRNAQLAFHGGAWVFPGGRLDPDDYAAGGADVVRAARHAAVREAREEAGLILQPDELVLVSRWITPALLPKRFDTWFFAALGDDAPVEVDGGEIHDHRWIGVRDALAAQRAGTVDLPPPTFVTIQRVVPYTRAAEALDDLARGPIETFEPRLFPIEGGACSLYAGDVAYDDGDIERHGPRNRLWMLEGGWRYERGR